MLHARVELDQGHLHRSGAIAAQSSLIHNALPAGLSKTLVQIGCADHGLFWEQCTGSNCNGWKGANETVAKHVNDWVLTGMIYASPGSDHGMSPATRTAPNAHTDGPVTDGPEILQETDGI